MHQSRHRHEFGAVVEDLVVNLVGQNHQPVLLGDSRDRRENLAGIHRAGGIVRIHDDDGARAPGDQRLDLVRVGHEAAAESGRGNAPLVRHSD